ncbi:zinc finger BED domain-containing protein 1-like [Rhizophagus clarus]|uniref:Zinc finger BED domain-containing protein 1-like n=1 Tax=Rhizophagus clarus TaxID=94130 RepID=A0A8H3LD27_9GLOM|nr:zinc finger BED domain-containing protein 1-like [Rhizophagus clarus]
MSYIEIGKAILNKVDIDRKLAKFFYSAGIPFTAIENPYWLDFIQTILPAYNSPNCRNLANNLLDAEYQVERQNLDKVLNNASNITLVSDDWSNIRRESVLNFILCLPKPIFYNAKYTGSESHTAEYIYNEFKSIIEDIGPSKFAGVERSMNQAKQIVNFFHTHHQAESILLNQLNTITLVQPVETQWGTCLDSIQSIRRCKLGLQMSVVQSEVSSKMTHDLKEQILGDLLWANLEALDYFLTPFVKLIRLFESDTPLLSYIYEEWRQIWESINAQVLDLNFKMKVHRLIDNRFEFAFHPAMAIANLLDPNFYGKSLGPTDFETIIIPYIEKVYTFEEAAHIYGVMQKYIAKTDEFSGALLWASIEYSSPITAAKRNWSNFGFIHSKLRTCLNNNRVKKLVAIYQNLRIHKEVKEDNWFEEDEV